MMRFAAALLLVLACSPQTGSGGGGPDSSTDAATTGDASMSPIDGNGCATQPCDIQTQCGCSAIEACDVDDQGGPATACRGASGGKEGTACTTSTACAAGYTCAYFGASGSCMRFCDADADCLGPRGECIFHLADSNGQVVPGGSLCTSNCDPTAINDPLCPAGWGCEVFSDAVDCRLAGAGMQGQDCSDSAPCAPGYTCTQFSSGPSKCSRTCSPPSNNGCPAPTACSAYTPPVVLGGTQYGVCL